MTRYHAQAAAKGEKGEKVEASNNINRTTYRLLGEAVDNMQCISGKKTRIVVDLFDNEGHHVWHGSGAKNLHGEMHQV